MKSILAFVIFLSIFYSTNAQTHNEFWSKLTISKKMSSKLSLATDLQLRQQANYRVTSKNIFETPYARAIRLWVNYKLKNNFTITTAPIAYFINEDIINANGILNNTSELRMAIGLTKNFIWERSKQNNRIFIEERFINYDSPNGANQYRYRLQDSFSFLVKKVNKNCNLNFQFLNELFVKTQESQTTFDQNRIQNTFQLQLNKMELSIGYQYTIQASNSTLIYRNQFLVTSSILL